MTIIEIQEKIIEQFDLLDADRQMCLEYLIELGEQMPQMPENSKTEDNIIKGCQSKVWLDANMQNNRLIFIADSNTSITKGLISLLVQVLSGQQPKDILNAELYFIDRIGMGNLIGSQRSQGLAHMIRQIKTYALAYSK